MHRVLTHCYVNIRRIAKLPQNMAGTKTVLDFGYAFNSNGQLRKVNENGLPGNKPFEFNVSPNHQECQKNYEQLGDAITEHVYEMLETQEGLKRLPVPKESNKKGTFIFVTKDYEKKDKLLVLIHGSGVVRAGQWARSLIINDSIHSGTQIPYIRRAVTDGYGVVIMNTNDNYHDDKKIESSGSPEEHAIYVWNEYIIPTKASKIAIVAHSFGGVVTLEIANKIKKDFDSRVKAVAFTDSVHGFSNLKISKDLKQIAKNWVSSNLPLDSPVKTPEYDIPRVSAGHPKHEMTSYSSMESVFSFINEKLK